MIVLTFRPAVRSALPAVARREFGRRVRRMVRAVALSDASLGRKVEVGLVLTDDDEIHALNRAYRHKDRATDVLAFALREAAGVIVTPGVLGDVVISVETARRQRKGTLATELEHLFAHGLCHLVGYDHRTDEEEATMNARMARLRAESKRRGRVRAA